MKPKQPLLRRGTSCVSRAIHAAFSGHIGAYTALYTVAFAVLAVLIFFPFYASDKSFIWKTDGMTQHYLALMYIGEWLRELAHNILVEHTFVIPLWDMSIGVGGDVLTTFNYYGLGDPLCLLSVFVREEHTMYLYNALVLVRFYLAGLFFSLYCFRMKQQGVEVLLGAFLYTFCGFAIYAGVRHPFFLVPMVLFPLLLLGAEQILDGKHPALFILSVCVAFISNFYFAYMLILLTVLYVAARFFTQKHDTLWKTLGKTAGKFVLYGIVGTLMACVLLLPVLLVYLGNGRAEVVRETPLFYNAAYYVSLYTGFGGFAKGECWLVTGFSSLTLLATLLLFKRKGEYTYLKWILVILFALLLIPYGGKVMNGFAYVANRWTWGITFFLAFAFVAMLKPLTRLERNEKRYLLAATGLYLVSCVILLNVKTNLSAIAHWILLAVALVLLLFGTALFSKRTVKRAVIGTVTLAILVNPFFLYSYNLERYTDEFIHLDDAYALVDDSVSHKMAKEMKKNFGRYEQNPNSAVRNQSVIDGSYGVSTYWSLTDNKVGQLLTETQAVVGARHSRNYINQKTFLNQLFSTRYFFTKNKAHAPFGYTYRKAVNTAQGKFYVYENENALPLGYGYSGYLTRDKYDTLSAAEKQEALLSNVLLETDVDGYAKNNYTVTSTVVPHTVKAGGGVTLDGNTVTVTKDKGKLTFTFDAAEQVELYLDVQGLRCDNELWTSEIEKINGTWDELMKVEKASILRRELFYTEKHKYPVSASDGTHSMRVEVRTPRHQNYDGQYDFLFHLGYADAARTTVTLTFADAGVYSFDRIRVIAQPMQNYVTQSTARRSNVLTDVTVTDNGFRGTADLSMPQLMYFSVPYSKGFTAYVDGKETEILQANTWGMALALPAGEHAIEFRYETRGLALGAVLTAVGILAFVGVLILERYKKKRRTATIERKGDPV